MPDRKSERGVVILLVAVVLLFIVVVMAALAIDLTTFYTARSEAQLAADGAALAGARVLANSGTTSNPSDADLASNAWALATTIATEVAQHNEIGGGNPTNVSVFPNPGSTGYNPQISVRVTRSDLPTFFARLWLSSPVTVSASATAEAYNPTSHPNITISSAPPVAPSCVKPWLLPNIDPLKPSQPIFDPFGVIVDSTLLGATPNGSNVSNGGTCVNGLCVACPSGNCTVPMTANAWQYYPGSQTDFPAPTQALPACSAGFTGVNQAYQLSIAGCVQQPIVCGQNSSSLTLDTVPGSTMDADTATAVNCLTHAQSNQAADSVAFAYPQPFQFLAGSDNPVVGARGRNVVVSSSLVTVPVVDVVGTWNSSPVKVIGFIQVFLNPGGDPAANGVPAEIVNLVGCGPTMSGQPILGNGASPVAVRLISR